MPTYTNGPGAVQTAYVGYRTIALTTSSLQLYWPNAFQATTDIMAAYMDVDTVSSSSNTIYMPDARQVSVGQNFIISNSSETVSFQLSTFNSGTVYTIYNGQGSPPDGTVNVYYFVLTDNSTADGVWRQVGFGSTTIAPQAANLASDHGIIASGGLLYTNSPITIEATSPLNINSIDDNASTFVWNTGAGQIILDPTADAQIQNGFYFCINTYPAQGQVTISDSNGYLIDGQTEKILDKQKSLMLVLSKQGVDPSFSYSWYSIGYAPTSVSSFDIGRVTVTGGSVTLSNSQAENDMLIFSGTLTSDCSVIFPNFPSEWQIVNNTTGAYSLTLYVVGSGPGDEQVIPQGDSLIYYNDNTSLKIIPTSSSSGTVQSVAVASPGNTISVSGSPITVNGTIDLDINTVSIAHGGTGETSAQDAFDALSPLESPGDILTYSAGTNIAIPLGAANTVVGVTLAGTLGYVPGFPTTTPTTGSIVYWNGSAWIALAPGANGDKLTLAGGVPTWAP